MVALDLRGHGLSGKPRRGHTLAQYARDVRDLLEHLDLRDATPVGWSIGTAVLLSYVEQFGTDRLDGLAFVDQRPKFHGEADWSHTLTGSFDGHAATELATNLEYNRPAAAKPFVEAMLADPPGANVIDGMNAETTETPTGAAIELFLDMAYSDLRPVLDEVDVPRLLIYGEQSSIFPTDVGAYMGSAIPEATHLRFEGSGHCPFWEGPDRFNEAVVAFAGQ